MDFVDHEVAPKNGFELPFFFSGEWRPYAEIPFGVRTTLFHVEQDLPSEN